VGVLEVATVLLNNNAWYVKAIVAGYIHLILCSNQFIFQKIFRWIKRDKEKTFSIEGFSRIGVFKGRLGWFSSG
jgi:hypothetical protein